MTKKDPMYEYHKKLEELEDFRSKGQISYKEYSDELKKLELQKPISKNAKIGLGLFFGIILLSTVVIGAVTSPDKPKFQQPIKYNYRLIKTEAIDPATLQFAMEIENSSDTDWDNPSCTITFRNSTSHYKGFDTFIIKPVKAHSSRSFVGNLTITNQGANYVNKYEVQCK